MKSFTPTYFRSNQSNVFNAVQADGVASIVGKSRPDMVVSLKCEYDAMIEKVKQLTELVKVGK